MRVQSDNPEWQEIEAALLRRKPTLKRTTLEQYELAARLLQGDEAATMTQRDLDRVRDAIVARYTRNSVRTMLTCIRAILRHVYRRRVTGRPELLAKGVLLFPVPRYRKRVDPVFSEAQTAAMERFVVRRKHPMVIAVFFLIYDGTLRISEVANLNLGDIDLEARQILVRGGKGDEDRIVMISTEATEAVRAWLDDRPEFADELGRAAFFSDRRNQYSRSRITRRIDRKFMTWHLKNIAEHANAPRPATPHLMRATGATHMLNNQANPEMVRQNMGHKNIETTMLYNRLPQEDARTNFDTTWSGIRKRRQANLAKEDILRATAVAFAKKQVSADTLERVMRNLRKAEESHASGRPKSTRPTKKGAPRHRQRRA